MKRLLFLITIIALPTFADQSLIPDNATISTLNKKILQDHISCVSIIEYYLERIKRYNFSTEKSAPLNAFVTINTSAISRAKELDQYYQKNTTLIGPLHCVPVILKDNIDSVETPSSSGSYALLGSQPIRDALLVEKLKHAGAVIIGKGGMDELAAGANGISSRSGRVGNVYNPNKNPGGSSSGPAVAVAANFAVIGIGTDNSGSIRIPATFNGLFGLRPSTGRVSMNGVFPCGTLDGAVGPITKSIEDLALTLSIISDKNKNETLDMHAIQGKRIAVVKRIGKIPLFDGKNQLVNAVLTESIARFQKLGAIITEISLPQFDNTRKYNTAGDTEFINQYLSNFPSTRKNFVDICESGRTANFKGDGDCRTLLKTDFKINGPEYKKAKHIFSENRQYVEALMSDQHIDALLLPISVGEGGDYDMMKVKTWRTPLSSNSGLPSLGFVVGFLTKPETASVSMELVGRQFDEFTILNIAYAYEQAFYKRPVPILSATSNPKIMDMSIPELNNFITAVGAISYDLVLKQGKPLDLTPEKFRQICIKTLTQTRGH